MYIYIYKPPVLHLLQTQQALTLTYVKVLGRPALEATQHHRPTQPHQNFLCCLSFLFATDV